MFLICNRICNRSYEMALNVRAYLDCDNNVYIRHRV